MQRNWVGKSVGAEVKFKVEGSEEEITVFTTRPDTLFGVTYLVIAPEHPLVDKLTKPEFKDKVEEYKESIKSFTEIERTSTVKEKTGVPIGAFAINPLNGEKVPIWIADYALLTYGTGCVMAVPAHDERDFEFAKKFNLPIKKVILQPGTHEEDELKSAYKEPGKMINSGQFDGTNSTEGIEKVTDYLAGKDQGRKKVNFRLRDWLISRQRYWGTPIPIIHCPKCGEVPVEEKDLPVELPYNVEFKPGGESPLLTSSEFMNVKCPKCGGDAKRDADTMDTFVDSSWYFLRYLNPDFEENIFDTDLTDKWVPVDMYVGGAEHATMHLLYARFIHKFLRDLGLAKGDEPFSNLIHQGTITNQGVKMSKSKGNVVNPDDFTKDYGADVFRLYLMFMGPYELGGDWSDKGISGTDRFVQRTYELFNRFPALLDTAEDKPKFNIDDLSEVERSVYRKTNQTVKKFGDEINSFRFNTAIASLMELINELSKNIDECSDNVKAYSLKRFGVLLGPVAPHLAEECLSVIGRKESLFIKPKWFEPDPDALIEDTVNIAVQVNGKLRDTIPMPLNSDQETVKKAVYASDKVTKHVEGKNIVKEIFVNNKIYNIVAK